MSKIQIDYIEYVGSDLEKIFHRSGSSFLYSIEIGFKADDTKTKNKWYRTLAFVSPDRFPEFSGTQSLVCTEVLSAGIIKNIVQSYVDYANASEDPLKTCDQIFG